MAELTTTEISFTLADGKRVTRKLSVFVSSWGEFQIEIPEELHQAARVLDDLEDTKASNLDATYGALRRPWHRKDCGRRNVPTRQERKCTGELGRESRDDCLWRIVSRQLDNAKKGIQEVAKHASMLPETNSLVILYHSGGGAVFSQSVRNPDVFKAARGDGGYTEWENHCVDTHEKGRNGFFQRTPGPITVELKAVVARQFIQPQLYGDYPSYRYEEVSNDDPMLGECGRELNSFRCLGWSLDEIGEGKYERHAHMRKSVPYTEDAALKFHDAMLGLSVTAWKIQQIFKTPETLLEGLSSLPLIGSRQ